MLFTDIVDPAVLTGAAREIPDPTTFTLKNFLPDKEIQATKVRVVAASVTRSEAKYRAWDAPTPVGKRSAQMTVTEVNLPALGQKLPLGEYESIQLQILEGMNNGALLRQTYDDTKANVDAIRQRMERARAVVATTGVMTITDIDGVALTADYGVDATHINVAPATVLWSDPTADFFGDLEAWWTSYQAGTVTVPNLDGQFPGRILTSRRAVNAARKTNQIVRAVFGPLATEGNVTIQQLNDALNAMGYPPFEIYSGVIGGQNLIPDDKVILGPTNAADLGHTTWGITAEAMTLAKSKAVDFTLADSPGITATQYEEPDPVQIFTKANATGMPVIERPDLLFVADVL